MSRGWTGTKGMNRHWRTYNDRIGGIGDNQVHGAFRGSVKEEVDNYLTKPQLSVI